MAKLTVEEQKEYAVLPADSILLLKVDELTEKEVNGANGPWTKLEIKFKVLGIQATGDGSPVDGYEDMIAGPIWGSVPLRLTEHPENKLRLWAEAILGIEMGLGFELDTDVFVGRECRGITSQYDKRNVDPKTGKPFKGHQVTSLLPKATGQYAAAAPAPAAPAADPWTTPTPQPAAADPWARQPSLGDDEPPF